MITVSKKSCMSLHALMFGAALFTGVSTYTIDAKGADQQDDKQYDLNDPRVRRTFGDALRHCQYFSNRETTRYNTVKECNNFTDMVYTMEHCSNKELYNAANRASRATDLVVLDSLVSLYGKMHAANIPSSSLREYQARQALEEAENKLKASEYADLVIEPTEHDKQRMKELEAQFGAPAVASNSNSSNTK